MQIASCGEVSTEVYWQMLIVSRKLGYFGHIMRGEDEFLEKGIIEGTLPDSRKRGRSRTAWIDNVTSWTGLKF